MNNYYATCVSINGYGVLLSGPSGSGKSDLALRLISTKEAVLVADDQVLLSASNGQLTAYVPITIAGKIEVRGLGIIDFPYQAQVKIDLFVELVKDVSMVERLPQDDFVILEGISVRRIKLFAFENSAPDKVALALQYFSD